jgi:hypothetical protein
MYFGAAYTEILLRQTEEPSGPSFTHRVARSQVKSPPTYFPILDRKWGQRNRNSEFSEESDKNWERPQPFAQANTISFSVQSSFVPLIDTMSFS